LNYRLTMLLFALSQNTCFLVWAYSGPMPFRRTTSPEEPSSPRPHCRPETTSWRRPDLNRVGMTRRGYGPPPFLTVNVSASSRQRDSTSRAKPRVLPAGRWLHFNSRRH